MSNRKPRAKHGMLVQNERLKLYKRVSTWIIIATVLGLIVLSMIIEVSLTDTFAQQHTKLVKWNQFYVEKLGKLPSKVDGTVTDEYKDQADFYRYLIDNEIPPWDWRYNVANAYFAKNNSPLLLNAKYKDEKVTDTRLKEFKSILDNNNWKDYVKMLKQDISDDKVIFESFYLNEVNQKLLDMYMENGIVPVSQDFLSVGSEISMAVENDEFWRSEQVSLIKDYYSSLSLGADVRTGEPLIKSEKKNVGLKIDVAIKRLSTNTPPIVEESPSGTKITNKFMYQMINYSFQPDMIIIILVVFASTVIASEFGNGTIKLLLITPHKRKRIFWAKFRLLIEVMFLLIISSYVLSFLISGIANMFKGIGAMEVVGMFGLVWRMPFLLYIGMRSLIGSVGIIAFVALAIMISTVSRKSGISIALTLVAVFGGQILMQILSLMRLVGVMVPGIKFLLFSNMYPLSFFPTVNIMNMGIPSTVDPTMTLGFSIIVLLVHSVLFLWIARDSFCRRDVK